MKVTLESTGTIVELVINGTSVPARLWQGTTAAGVECHAFITRIAVDKALDTSQFERELQEQATPRADLRAYPLRVIL